MTTLREFRLDDIFHMNYCNQGNNFNFKTLMEFQAKCPDYSQVAESPNGQIIGWLLGNRLGTSNKMRCHLKNLTVAPDYQQLGIGAQLVNRLEEIAVKINSLDLILYVDPDELITKNLLSSLNFKNVCTLLLNDGKISIDVMLKTLKQVWNKQSFIP